MNTMQTAKLTGIPHDLLVRMRARETRTRKSGPPFCKIVENGFTEYVYDRKDVRVWMKMRKCLITAADAALLLDVTRDDVLAIHGLQGFNVNTKKARGRLIVDNVANVYIWLPVKKKGTRA